MTIPGSTPSNQRPSSSAEDQPREDLAEQATATLKAAREQGNEKYEELRDLATDQIDSLAEGAQSAAAALAGKDSLGLSQYLGQLASGMGTFAEQLRNDSAEDLLHKGARLARDNPGAFLFGSVAIGFCLSRFLRATATEQKASPEDSAISPDSAIHAPSGNVSTDAEDPMNRPSPSAITATPGVQS